MRRLWAVARETFLECVRMRIVLLYMVLLSAVVICSAMAEGDGTLKGRLQTFLAYTTSLVQLKLGLVTVFLATRVISRDIERKYIFLVAAKPLPRWQYILGRWAGLVLLDAVLLGISFTAIYGFAQYLRSQPTRDEVRVAAGQIDPRTLDRDRMAVESEIFTARLRYSPKPPDLEPIVNERLAALDQEKGLDNIIKDHIAVQVYGRNVTEKSRQQDATQAEIEEIFSDPTARDQIRKDITNEVRQQVSASMSLIRVGETMPFFFENLPQPSYAEPLHLQYKIHPIKTPENYSFRSSWVVYDKNAGPRPLYPQADSTESVNTQLIPPDAVRNNQLTLLYLNADTEVNSQVKMDAGEVSLLIRAGSFEGNIARSAAIVLIRMAFLAGIGVLFGAFLSFQVACLTCLLVLCISFMSTFIKEATDPGMAWNNEVTIGGHISYYMARGLFVFVPNFSENSPVDCLIDGEIMPLRRVLQELSTGIGLRTWLALAVGCLIFYRRELARVQV